MSVNANTPGRRGPRPLGQPVLLPIGSRVEIDARPFAVGRTRDGRVVLFARDGSRAWLDEEDLATLHCVGRLRVVGAAASRPIRRRGHWNRR